MTIQTNEASLPRELTGHLTEAAVAAAPQMVTAWVALGQALKAAQRSDEAERAYTGRPSASTAPTRWPAWLWAS
jgi:hypothetical protein